MILTCWQEFIKKRMSASQGCGEVPLNRGVEKEYGVQFYDGFLDQKGLFQQQYLGLQIQHGYWGRQAQVCCTSGRRM